MGFIGKLATWGLEDPRIRAYRNAERKPWRAGNQDFDPPKGRDDLHPPCRFCHARSSMIHVDDSSKDGIKQTVSLACVQELMQNNFGGRVAPPWHPA